MRDENKRKVNDEFLCIVGFAAAAIEADLDLFESGQAFGNGFIYHGKKSLNLLAGIHDLHDNWKVHGQAEDFGGVNAAVSTESFQSAQHGGPGQTVPTGFADNPLEERESVVAVALTDKDS
jgi:hypothetical protein